MNDNEVLCVPTKTTITTRVKYSVGVPFLYTAILGREKQLATVSL